MHCIGCLYTDEIDAGDAAIAGEIKSLLEEDLEILQRWPAGIGLLQGEQDLSLGW